MIRNSYPKWNITLQKMEYYKLCPEKVAVKL